MSDKIHDILSQLATHEDSRLDAQLCPESLMAPGGILALARLIARQESRLIALQQAVDALQDAERGD